MIRRRVREIRGKIAITEEREMTFGSSYRQVRKTEGSRNRDSTVVILKPCVLYVLHQQPAKLEHFFSYEKFKKVIKTALCGAIQNGSFQSHHKNRSLALRLF